MKVISIGTWEKRLTCRGCKSVLQATVDDVEHEQRQQEDESFADQFYIICPICTHKNVQRDIPPLIAEQISKD